MSLQESKLSAVSGTGTPDPATSVPTKDSTPANGKGKNHHRKGKGARNRKEEEFTRKKNLEFQARLDAEDEEWANSFKRAAEVFGQRAVPQIVIPHVSVEVATDVVVDIVTDTVDVLYTACKIPPNPHAAEPQKADVMTLLLTTAHQLDAKFRNAVANSCFAAPDDWSTHEQTVRATNLLDRALLPIAYLIHQIGKTSIMGQMVFPKPCDVASLTISALTKPNARNRIFQRPIVSELFAGPTLPAHTYPTGEHASDNGRMKPVYFRVTQLQLAYNDQIVTTDGLRVHLNLANFNRLSWQDKRQYGHEIIFDGRVEVPDLSEVHQRYVEFCGRVEKKLSQHAFSALGLSEGRGTAAQIVGVHFTEDSPHDRMATSLRHIEDVAYQVGAYLGLGYDTGHPFHDEDVALQRVRVDATGAVKNLVSLLTKRLR